MKLSWIEVGPNPMTAVLRRGNLGTEEHTGRSPHKTEAQVRGMLLQATKGQKLLAATRGRVGAWNSLLLRCARRNQPCQPLHSGRWSLELQDDAFLLSLTPQLTVHCYSSPKELMDVTSKPTLNRYSLSCFKGNNHSLGENIFKIPKSYHGQRRGR